jgi:V/A-type H+/Na+-transporting ATPase subunit E
MESRTTSDERLAAICQMIRNETLDPALKEAETIKLVAEREAARIKAEAKLDAEKIIHDARQAATEEKEAFEASLQQGSLQFLGVLKEQVEKNLFDANINKYLTSEFADNVRVGQLIELIMAGLKKEGIFGNIELYLGSHIARQDIAEHLLKESLSGITTLKGDFPSGILVKVSDQHLSIEITPEAIQEIITPFVRPDFRRFLFSE